MNGFQSIKSETKINSLFVLKEILSFLPEKQKLYVIIYNKHLQKEYDINIENYKRIRGIYKEDGKNGKGKEYDISTKIMVFEGEYLNGKKNGKGKEYYFDGK